MHNKQQHRSSQSAVNIRDTIQKDVASAERAVALGRHELAIILYQRAIDAYPDETDRLAFCDTDYLSLAHCHLAIAASADELGKTNQAKANFRHGYLLQAQHYCVQENMTALIEACDNAFKYGPKFIKGLLLRAKGYECAEQPNVNAAILDLEEALQLINPLSLDYDPTDYEAIQNGLGICYAILNKHHKALGYFSKSIQRGCIKDNVYLNRGESYLELNQLNAAIRDFKEAIQLNSKSFVAYRKLGLAYQKKGDFELSFEAYTHSLKLKKDAYTFFCLGSAYDLLNRHDDAIHYYTEALALSDDFKDAFYARATVYLKRNDRQKNDIVSAIQDFKTVMALDPRMPRFLLAQAYAKQGQYIKALSTFTEASGQDSMNPDILVKRGQIFHLIAECDLAFQDYSEALELDPTHSEAHYCAGVLAFDQDDIAIARAHFQKSIDGFDPKKYAVLQHPLSSSKPNSDVVEAMFLRGTAYYYLGIYEQACEDLSYCVTHAVNPACEHYNNRGLVHRLLGQYGAGIDDFTQALLYSQGALFLAYRNRALCYYQNRQYHQALEDYSTYLMHRPKDIVALNNLGGCYFKLGNYELAHKAYSDVLMISPNDPEATQNLSALNRLLSLSQNSGSECTSPTTVSQGSLFRPTPVIESRSVDYAGKTLNPHK